MTPEGPWGLLDRRADTPQEPMDAPSDGGGDTLRKRLEALEHQAELGGGQERIAKQHESKKLTARELARSPLTGERGPGV